MSVFLIVLIGIVMFGLLIAVHEFGHFIVAKLSGVRVNEFAIGMGPKLWSRQGSETFYSLRLFPIGGYCAMEGEDEDTGDPRSFHRAKAWKKFLILVAGAAMNFLVGFLIFLGLSAMSQSYQVDVVTAFEPWSMLPAQGLEIGDQFLSVDGHAIWVDGDTSLFLGRTGDRADIEVLRDGRRVLLKDVDMTKTPVFQDNGTTRMLLGVTVGTRAYPASWGDRLRLSWYNSIDTVRLVWISLGDLLTGAVGVRDMSGPVGIVDMMGQMAGAAQTTSIAFMRVLYFVAFIAINLAVMNLLPIPALDGGRIFFLVVNLIYTALTKRHLDPKYEGAVNTVCFVALLGLMAVVAVSDVLKLFGR